MELISLLMPAVITVSVRHKRNNGVLWKWFDYVKEYVLSVLANVAATQIIVVYVIRATGVGTQDFERFAFSAKYLVIACFLAFVFPYIWEALSKAVSVSVDVERAGK